MFLFLLIRLIKPTWKSHLNAFFFYFFLYFYIISPLNNLIIIFLILSFNIKLFANWILYFFFNFFYIELFWSHEFNFFFFSISTFKNGSGGIKLCNFFFAYHEAIMVLWFKSWVWQINPDRLRSFVYSFFF